MESQEVDLAKAPLVVVGPRESGKSNTLQWVASQFVETKLRWIKESADLDEMSEGAVLLIDDSERFDDYALDDQLRLLRFERNCPVVLALNPRNTISSLARDVVRDATFLVLQPDDRHSSNFIQNYFDRSPYLRPGLQFPAGRGVLSIGRGASVIQVPLVGH
jgi:signal recognition particle receptor subunit beta